MTKADVSTYVDRYSDLILRLSYTYLGSVADAEDIVQDVLIKLMLNAPSFSDTEYEKAWVIRTTVNRCKDVLKSAHRKRTAALYEQVPHPSSPSAEEEALRGESDVLYAIRKLPEDQRVSVFLYYYEDMSVSEISGVTKKTPAAIMKQLSRARAALRETLKENGHE